MWWQAALVVSCAAAAAPPLPFARCSASSVNTDGATRDEFAASNALTPGLDYWCSEPNLDSTEEVIWRGQFDYVTELRALDITWAFAPSQIKILGKADPGSADHLILNWRACVFSAAEGGAPARLSERVDFPKGVEALTEVKIVMKGTNSDFIGIQQVQALGSDEQIFMLLSGIKSPQYEQCLSVAPVDRSVVLDACLGAIAAGDGREIWQLTRSGQLLSTQSGDPTLCLHYQPEALTQSDNRDLSVRDCAESGARFTYMPNAQIAAGPPGPTAKCLNVEGGEVPGYQNLLDSHTAGAEASTSIDVEHDANNALSPSTSTFWCSTVFADCSEHNVFWQFDFGQPVDVNKILIDWEYAPLHYSLLQSLDGVAFGQIFENPANSRNRTVDDLRARIKLRFVRVAMHKPHPLHGSLSGQAIGGGGTSAKYAYGIRNIQVLMNQLAVRLSPCTKANGAGSKWFRSTVKLFDSDNAQKIRESQTFDGGLKAVQDATSDLYDRLPEIERCSARTQDVAQRFTRNIKEVLPDFTLRLAALQQKPGAVDLVRAVAPSPGSSWETPLGFGCQKHRPIGFYYVNVPCSPQKVRRLFCTDEGIGFALYTGPRLTSRKTTLDVERACAVEGFTPAPITSLRQVEMLLNMLRAMGTVVFEEPDANIPIAWDLGCSTDSGCVEQYYDLLTYHEASGVLSHLLRQSVARAAPPHQGALAITSLQRTLPVELIDWVSQTPVGYLCAAKATSSTLGAALTARLDCGTTALSPIFQGGINTFFRVACPSNCKHARHAVYGGRDGVYADRSSVCLAAIHQAIEDAQEFVIALETPHAVYQSVYSNGVSSQALSAPTSYAFRLSAVETRCPVSDLVNVEDEASAKKLSAKPPTLVITPDLSEEGWSPGYELGEKKALAASMNQAARTGAANNRTAEEAAATQRMISDSGAVDGTSVTFSRQTSMTGLTLGRAAVKPIETTMTRFISRSDQVYMQLSHSVQATLGVIAAYFTKFEETQVRLDLQNAQRSGRIAPLMLEGGSSHIEQFDVLPEGKASSLLSWSLSATPENRTVIKVTGSVEPHSEAPELIEGQPLGWPTKTFITHRNQYHYDLTLSVRVAIAQQTDVAMIGWRVRKTTGDGYWLLLKASATASATDIPPSDSMLAKLIRRTKGQVSVLSHWVYATVNDISKCTVDVQVTRGRHSVSLDGKRVIDLVDELAMTGHLAFGVYLMAPGAGSVTFDPAVAAPNCCQTLKVGQLVQAAHCFKWSDSGRHLSAAQLFETTTLEIERRRNYRGRPLAFEALLSVPRAMPSPVDETSSMSLTPLLAHDPLVDTPQAFLVKPQNRPQLCASGKYRVEFISPVECPDLEFGPVVGRSTRNFQWLAVSPRGIVRSYRVGAPGAPVTVLSESYIAPLKAGEWYGVASVVSDSVFGVSVFNSTRKAQGNFQTTRIDNQEGYVGWAARGCPTVPFASVSVEP